MAMIHDITSITPRNKRPKRKGRGESSGKGKTSGRGTKAAHGGDVHWKPGHEGGQTPLFRRLPKRGFSNFKFERRFHIVNLSELNRFDNGATVDAQALKEVGLVPDSKQPVKILGDGEISKKLTIVAGWFSKSAHAKITKAGGTAQNLKGEAFEFPKPKKKFIPRKEEKGGKKKKQQQEEAPAEAAAPAEGAAPAPAPEQKSE